MSRRTDLRWALGIAVGFVLLYFFPAESPRFSGPVMEAVQLARWYAREHVLLCLVPGLLHRRRDRRLRQPGVGDALPRPAGAAAAGLRRRFGLGHRAGGLLVHRAAAVRAASTGVGAGLGPASAFLYSGPAINALAIILTARVLGLELGVARAVGAVAFSIVIGLAMAWLYRREERGRAAAQASAPSRRRRAIEPAAAGGLLRPAGGDPGVRQLGARRTAAPGPRSTRPSGG